MSTTIQVEENTLRLLKLLKEHFGVHTYNEAIEKMAKKGFRQKSMYGFLGKMDRKEILKGLRDKHDRF
ncbi:hypothetical protein HYV82_04190 [Candidatus Woesearchaeota archaeon]|nr:hypothetical protein [Candidatus Woesearchaeota archaeon]